ncbi:hypothetical protein [Streptomyces sp. NBC_00388]|uniref:hypothetical protein n=1 Tax=Streptomyces sp. NBC_00388 TaxID=2975735 RepID=UPI002E2074D7
MGVTGGTPGAATAERCTGRPGNASATPLNRMPSDPRRTGAPSWRAEPGPPAAAGAGREARWRGAGAGTAADRWTAGPPVTSGAGAGPGSPAEGAAGGPTGAVREAAADPAGAAGTLRNGAVRTAPEEGMALRWTTGSPEPEGRATGSGG